MASLGGAVRWQSRRSCWRLAVFVSTTARRSESLRTRLGGRLAAAFGGCLRSKAGLRRAPQRGGRLRSDCGAAVYGGSALLPRCVRGGLVVGAAVLLVVAECSVPHATYAPNGSRPVRWHQAGSHLLATGNARPDTTGPACLGKPRIRGVGPRTQHPYGEKDPPNHVVGPCSAASGRSVAPPTVTQFGGMPHLVPAAGGLRGHACALLRMRLAGGWRLAAGGWRSAIGNRQWSAIGGRQFGGRRSAIRRSSVVGRRAAVVGRRSAVGGRRSAIGGWRLAMPHTPAAPAHRPTTPTAAPPAPRSAPPLPARRSPAVPPDRRWCPSPAGRSRRVPPRAPGACVRSLSRLRPPPRGGRGR